VNSSVAIQQVNRLIFFAALYTGSAALLKLAGFIFFLWLARTLSVEDYANWGLLYAVQTALTSFGLVGIIEAVVGLLRNHRSPDEQKRLLAAGNTAFLVTLAASVALALVVWVMFAGHSQISGLTLSSVLGAGALLAYSSLQAQLVRLEERHFASLCFSFFLPAAGFLGSFAAFFFERTVESFFWGACAGLTTSMVGTWLCRMGFHGRSRMADARPILLRVTPFITVAFLGWLSGYGNNFVIKLFFDSSEIARFTFAMAVSSVMQLVASALNQVWSPRFYRITQEMPFEHVEQKNHDFFRLQGIVLGATGGAVIALYPSLIKLVGGNLAYYQSMDVELLLLFSAYLILSPWWHCHNYFLAYDKGSIVMKIVLMTSIVGVVLWLILMWALGPIGIYVGFFTQMLTRSVGILLVARTYWPVRTSWDGVLSGVVIMFIGFAASRV